MMQKRALWLPSHWMRCLPLILLTLASAPTIHGWRSGGHHPYHHKSHSQQQLRSRAILENSEELVVPLVLDLLFIGEAVASEIETLDAGNALVMALCGVVQQQVRNGLWEECCHAKACF
jgi:hypothetical protein